MNITEQKINATLNVEISGRIDTSTAPELENNLIKKLTDIKELILDFSKVEYISSAGLRVILELQKTMNEQGSMKILHVNNLVKEVFEMTGFINILTVE